MPSEHINSIGAGIYTRLLFETGTVTAESFVEATDYRSRFATWASPGSDITAAANTFSAVPDMREAPSFGVPPSLVNVPGFGSATSKQVQGQADPTNIEVAIN